MTTRNSNMKLFYDKSAVDTARMWTSSLCAVHCLLLPAFLSLSVFRGFVFLNDPLLENVIIIISAALGEGSLFPSYFRHHRKLTAIGILLFGFLLMRLSRFMVNTNEPVLTSSGAILVASARYLNFKLYKSR